MGFSRQYAELDLLQLSTLHWGSSLFLYRSEHQGHIRDLLIRRKGIHCV